MKKTFLLVMLALSACVDTPNDPNIYASQFILDPSKPPITLHNGNFLYDKDAPVLKASEFLTD